MFKQVFPIVAAMLTYLHTVNTSWRYSGFRNYKTYSDLYLLLGHNYGNKHRHAANMNCFKWLNLFQLFRICLQCSERRIEIRYINISNMISKIDKFSYN